MKTAVERIAQWPKLLASVWERMVARWRWAAGHAAQRAHASREKENAANGRTATNQAPSAPEGPAELPSPKEDATPRQPSGAALEVRVREILEQLPALADNLRAARTGVEPEFMRIGSELQVIHQNAAALTRQVLALADRLCGQENNGPLFRMRGLAEEGLAKLEDCGKDTAESLAGMKHVAEHLGAYSAFYSSVERIALLLGIIGMAIAIESSRATESTALFAIMAQTCREIANKIKSICASGAAAAGAARNEMAAPLGAVDAGLKEIIGLTEDARAIVRDAAGEIERLLAFAMQAAEQGGEQSRRLSRQVADLVVAVQFHDSMSQRLEHVEQALGDTEEALAAGVSGAAGVAGERPMAKACLVLKLQAAQIQSVVAEIDSVFQRGVRSFEEIARETGVLLNCLSATGPGADPNPGPPGADGNPFDRLRSSFGELDAVLQRNRVLMEPVQHAASRVADTVERISAFALDIRATEFELRLMALNAIVKAAQLGRDGCALEVLAQEVNRVSAEGAPVLERMNALLDLVAGAVGEFRRQDTAAKAAVSSDGAIEEIAQAYARFRDDSAAALARTDEIRQAIANATASLGFLPALGRQLAASHQQCEAMARDLSLLAGGTDSLVLEEAGGLRARYTMNQERDVHATVFSGSPDPRGEQNAPAGDAQVPPTEAGGQGDRKPLPEETPGKAAASGDGMVLFDPPAPEAKEGAAGDSNKSSGTNQEELGDNVELF